MSEAALSEQRVLARPVLLYQTVKISRKFHAPDCACTGRGDESRTAETTVRGALALNYHPAGCVDSEVREVLGNDLPERQDQQVEVPDMNSSQIPS